MKRMLLFPLVPALAWTQQVPSSEAEKALRDRVDQFYKLLVDKKYRQAEALVEEESKDRYYNWSKPDMRGFTVKSVELQEDGRAAKVTVTVSMVMSLAGAPPIAFDIPATTIWHMENGIWALWIDPDISLQTPFGKIPKTATDKDVSVTAAPNFDVLRNRVLLDRDQVRLTAETLSQSVTILNPLTVAVDLQIVGGSHAIPGILTEIDTPHLGALGQTSVRFRVEKNAPHQDTVRISVSPTNQILEIHVVAN